MYAILHAFMPCPTHTCLVALIHAIVHSFMPCMMCSCRVPLIHAMLHSFMSPQVAIRSCSGPDNPIVVDVNNIFRQVYVWGNMSWQGSIRFKNSFPSPRRGGLWALISVLSIEQAGVIQMLVSTDVWQTHAVTMHVTTRSMPALVSDAAALAVCLAGAPIPGARVQQVSPQVVSNAGVDGHAVLCLLCLLYLYQWRPRRFLLWAVTCPLCCLPWSFCATECAHSRQQAVCVV
jgi:hypothetical protein